MLPAGLPVDVHSSFPSMSSQQLLHDALGLSCEVHPALAASAQPRVNPVRHWVSLSILLLCLRLLSAPQLLQALKKSETFFPCRTQQTPVRFLTFLNDTQPGVTRSQSGK